MSEQTPRIHAGAVDVERRAGRVTRILTPAVGAVALLALAGCSSAGTSAATETPTTVAAATASASATASTPTPTPSPTVMTKAQAADWYLGTVCPGNIATEAASASFSGKYADELDLAQVRRLSSAAAEAGEAQILRFQTPPLPWPADVRDAVTKLTARAKADVAYFRAIARAKTAAATITATNTYTGGANTAAKTARAALGLPVPGSKSDGCAKWLAANP